MVSQGKEIRLSKIINPEDGKAVVVAADHGFMLGAIKGVVNLEETLRKVIEGGPDAILLSPGQAIRLNYLFHGKNAPALLIRADWTNAFRDKTYTLPARKIKRVAVAKAKDAIALGATGIVTYYFLGQADEEEEAINFDLMSSFSKECEKIGLPLIVEALPMGERVTGANYADLIAMGIRIAAEAGADAIKTAYTGDVETFSKAVSAAGIPVLVLGGARAQTIRDALEIAEEALVAGGSGVVFGRQVLQNEDPKNFISLLRQVVHEGKSVIDVISHVEGPTHLLVNAAACIGCLQCQLICSFFHEKVFSIKKARIKIDASWPGKFLPQPCTLCGKCVNACPTGALRFHPNLKYVEFIQEKCIGPQGCQACVSACPFGIVGWDDEKSIPYICDMCNGSPRCAIYCPTNALKAAPYRRS